jgi:hypothetical protein
MNDVMNDRDLNNRLIELGNTAADAHDMLRGVLDALAVIGQSSVRAATDDFDGLDDRDAWRDEAETAAHQSESLLREAASLLNRAAENIESAADRLPEGE